MTFLDETMTTFKYDVCVETNKIVRDNEVVMLMVPVLSSSAYYF